jgi:RHS repeat-associated protein
MTNSTFAIGSPSKSYVNGLTWNPNGTLQQLATTDPFNSANALTCSYLYDDLGRVGLKPGLAPPTYYADNCGTGHWQQNFTYDAFGNITKSGSSQWQPGYNQSINRIQLSGSTYDGNGNLTNDVAHTYSWDPNFQNPSTIDGVALTYDALNQMVEQNLSGIYTQILYSPIGKVGTFNGQTTKKASIPLPGGAVALFVPGYSGLIAHKDWLGSTRFISNRSTRALWGDYSYAPFGESSYTNGSSSGLNFTGQAQDTTTGLYDFQYREYSPVQGRWVSPDPAGPQSVDFSNPQSWNRYSYVLNNPLNLIDAYGLDCAYLNDNGDGLDTNGLDHNSNSVECAQHGGQWLEGTIQDGSVGANADTGQVWGTNSEGVVVTNQPGVSVDVIASFDPLQGSISDDPGGKSTYCFGQAAKAVGQELVGFEIANGAVNGLDSFVASHSGPVVSPNSPNALLSPSVAGPFAESSSPAPSASDIAIVGTSAHVLDGLAESIHHSPFWQQELRRAARGQGFKVSTKAVSKFAKTGGKILGALGAALTAYSGWESYNACMKD